MVAACRLCGGQGVGGMGSPVRACDDCGEGGDLQPLRRLRSARAGSRFCMRVCQCRRAHS